jgi:hypothetical protein
MIKIGEDKMHIYGRGEGFPTLIFTCGTGIGFTLGKFYKDNWNIKNFNKT